MLSDEVMADLIETLLPAGGTVLDVGCGGVHTLAVLAGHYLAARTESRFCCRVAWT